MKTSHVVFSGNSCLCIDSIANFEGFSHRLWFGVCFFFFGGGLFGLVGFFWLLLVWVDWFAFFFLPQISRFWNTMSSFDTSF